MASVDLAPANCLQPTYFLDYDAPEVSEFAIAVSNGACTDRDKAISLYYAVRDDVRYDAYRFEVTRPAFRASLTLANRYGFCITKAVLLAAAARSIGIPARLGYGDVRNHLTTERLRRKMKTDLFVFHGYTELWIDGRWVKATPAFNRTMCEKFGVLPLEFDGREDSLFHQFTADGSRHMEYVQDRGVFADVPFDQMIATWQAETPAALTEEYNDEILGEGDFAEDGAREREVGSKN